MSEAAIEVLHVGSASRDLTDDDPRGWRLGGGVTYAALTTARLGSPDGGGHGRRPSRRVGRRARPAPCGAGVELRVVPLAESPVFRNDEAPGGRIQLCLAPGQPLPIVDLPRTWTAATAWSVVPVAARDRRVMGVGRSRARRSLVLGWQGWLRELVAGRAVRHRPPQPSAAAPSRGPGRGEPPRPGPGADARHLRSRILKPDAGLVVTDGERGGRFLRTGPRRRRRRVADTTPSAPDGGGRPDGGRRHLPRGAARRRRRPSIVPDGGPDVAVGSRVRGRGRVAGVERPGVLGVPDLAAVLARIRRAGRAGRASPATDEARPPTAGLPRRRPSPEKPAQPPTQVGLEVPAPVGRAAAVARRWPGLAAWPGRPPRGPGADARAAWRARCWRRWPSARRRPPAIPRPRPTSPCRPSRRSRCARSIAMRSWLHGT